MSKLVVKVLSGITIEPLHGYPTESPNVGEMYLYAGRHLHLPEHGVSLFLEYGDKTWSKETLQLVEATYPALQDHMNNVPIEDQPNLRIEDRITAGGSTIQLYMFSYGVDNVQYDIEHVNV